MLVIGGVANRHNGDKMTSSDTSSHHVVTKADVDAVKWRGPDHFAIAANIYLIHISMWNGKNQGTGGDLQELAGLCRSSTEVSLLPCVRLTSSQVNIQSPSSGQGWHQSWNGCRGFLIYTADQSCVCLTYVDRESSAPLQSGKLCSPQHVCVLTFIMQQSVHTGHILMSQAFQST